MTSRGALCYQIGMKYFNFPDNQRHIPSANPGAFHPYRDEPADEPLSTPCPCDTCGVTFHVVGLVDGEAFRCLPCQRAA